MKLISVILLALLLSSCGTPEQQPYTGAPDTGSWQALSSATYAESTLDYRMLGDGPALLAVAGQGLQLRDAQQQQLDLLAGSFEQVDVRPLATAGRWLLASVDGVAQRVVVAEVAGRRFAQHVTLPAQDYEVAGVCLYQNAQGDNYLFMVSEAGTGSQWLLGNADRLLATPLRVRTLPFPPQAQYCQVDDRFGDLYVNEESVGFWRYPAAPEAPTERHPVAMFKPFGALSGEAGNLAVVPGGLLLVDPKAAMLHPLQRTAQGWKALPVIPLPGIGDAQQLHTSLSGDELTVTLRDDDNGRWWQGSLAWPSPALTPPSPLPVVRPALETDPAGTYGDVIDDPAVWVDPSDPQQSLILGTNKKAGLRVYTLDGHLRQSLDIGRLNNVDLRSGVRAGDKLLTIAAASHRDLGAISLFTIDADSRDVAHVADIPTPLHDIYGLCLYQPDRDHLYAFVNDKDGTMLQYRIDPVNLSGEEVRRWRIPSQPEGCVADDRTRRLFIGEEDVGVWLLGAEPDAGTQLQSVVKVGGLLHDDVEGLALYHRPDGRGTYLVISSQGSDSYLIVDAEAPYTVRGAFRIGAAAAAGIDGTAETDGLEAVSANLGGIWSKGMLVVQDGRNRMPEAPQNFKLVPWSQVESVLGLKPTK